MRRRKTIQKEKKLMRPKLVLAVSALALGTTLGAIPAFAQGTDQGNPQQSNYPVGRPMNDGGFQSQSNQAAPSDQAQRNLTYRGTHGTGTAENRARRTGNSPSMASSRTNQGARMHQAALGSEAAQRHHTYRGTHATGTAENRAQLSGNPSDMASAQGYPTGPAMNGGGFPAEQAQNAGPTNYAYDPYSGYGGGFGGYGGGFGGYGGGFGGYGGGPYYDYAGGPTPAGGPMNSAAIQACQARFQSYDPNTGTYLGFDGIRHACP
jgi:BA14K-like protein